MTRATPRYQALVCSRTEIHLLLNEWLHLVVQRRDRLLEVVRSGVEDCDSEKSWYSASYIHEMRLVDTDALAVCSELVRVSYGTLGQAMRCMADLSSESGARCPGVFRLVSALSGDMLFMQNGIFAAFPELDKYASLPESGPPVK